MQCIWKLRYFCFVSHQNKCLDCYPNVCIHLLCQGYDSSFTDSAVVCTLNTNLTAEEETQDLCDGHDENETETSWTRISIFKIWIQCQNRQNFMNKPLVFSIAKCWVVRWRLWQHFHETCSYDNYEDCRRKWVERGRVWNCCWGKNSSGKIFGYRARCAFRVQKGFESPILLVCKSIFCCDFEF